MNRLDSSCSEVPVHFLWVLFHHVVSLLQVCFFVALYYNVIISWSLFYFSQSFQQPLPWHECPLVKNKNSTCKKHNQVVEGSTRTHPGHRSVNPQLWFHFLDLVPECEKSSATTYYWYRQALDISDSISESGGLNWKMTLCLFFAWLIVCLAMIKGIQSSGKVWRGFSTDDHVGI